MRCFIINGKGTSGKDTFTDEITRLCEEKNLKCITLSSIDEIKEIAREYFYWNDKKDLKSRKMLSDLKDLHSQYCNGPTKYMLARYDYEIKQRKTDFIFFHIREPEEILELQKLIFCKTILIKKQTLNDKKFGNHADDNVELFEYDFVIENDSTLDKYLDKILNFFKKELYFY